MEEVGEDRGAGKKEHLTDDNFETLRALKINYEAITEPFTFYEQLTAITLELADDVSSLTEEALKEKVNAFEQKLKQIDEEIKNYNARNTIATASEQANGIVDDANGQLRLLHRDLRNENNNISATNHTLRTMSILAMVGGGVLLLVGLILANPMIIGVGAGMGIVGAGCFFHFNSKCNQQQAGSSYIPTEAGNTPPAASN